MYDAAANLSEGGSHLPLTRMSRREYVKLLSQLDHAAGPEPKPCAPTNRRLQQRIPFHREVRIVIGPEDGAACTEVSARCRNISQRGLAFLHHNAIEVGSRCEVLLPSLGGHIESVAGIVVRDRLLRGDLHEIAIRLGCAIDLARLQTSEGVVGSIPSHFSHTSRRKAV